MQIDSGIMKMWTVKHYITLDDWTEILIVHNHTESIHCALHSQYSGK